MSSPRVSILLPVRDEERHLPSALASLERQTFSDWELIAVDDGSTDGTAQLLDDFAAGDRRIRVVHRPPTGLVAALNAGLALCRAPLVARMDGDDVCHPERLARQVAVLDSQPEIDLVACRVRHIPRPRLTDGMLHYEAWQNRALVHGEIVRDLYVESPFAHPSVMFRRATVARLGGYRDCGWAEDYDLWLRMAAAGGRFVRLPETLFYWRDRPERLTRTAASCSAEAFRACKAHHLGQGFLAGRAGVTLWGAGAEGKAWRSTLVSIDIRVERWLEVDPRKLGQTIHGAPVEPPASLLERPARTLVTVGSKGAREEIRAWCDRHGLREQRDYLCVT